MSVANTHNYPLISVIVPVHNVEPYLRRCLDSIIEQTYQNLEIIIVASPSPDNSVGICEEYKTRDVRIALICTEPKGLSDAKNKGVESAHGEYLCFVDSDDHIHPEYISRLYTILIQNDCEISLCHYKEISTFERLTCPIRQPSNSRIYSGKEMCANLYFGFPIIASWGKLYHSSLFTSIKYPVGKINEDQATTYQLFYLAKKVGVIGDDLYYYSLRETSIMGQSFSLKRLDDLEFVEEQLSFFKNKGENKLYGLCLLYYLSYLYYFLHEIKCCLPQEKCLITELRRKKIKTIILILENHEITIIWKGKTIIYNLFPYKIKTRMRNSKWTSKFINKMRRII